MSTDRTNIYVFAHWEGMDTPELIGVLSAQQTKARKVFSFAYDSKWLNSKAQHLIDPDIQFYSGQQFPYQKDNFGVILDSMPDTWGRTLMRRRAAQIAVEQGTATPSLYDVDFLLGVYDATRMGALRFKLDLHGDFLDNNQDRAAPPWSTVRELQQAVANYENDINNEAVNQWLKVLIAPGSSLGGARPKANILDPKGKLWIAKFPSQNDVIDKAAWEFLAHKLVLKAGITMSPCKLERISGNHRTFFTQRFDRKGSARIHFSSAMTLTGNNEETIKANPDSYLHIAEFIQNYCHQVEDNLQQLWRRIAFNVAISNTDDHLRNHGFILSAKGWSLSPAYDLNPSIDKNGLALNIDMDNNALDFDLLKSVGPYFRLQPAAMEQILKEVLTSVQQWPKVAAKIGISRAEQELMRPAFRI